MRRASLLAIAVFTVTVGSALFIPTAHAVPITYTFSGIASGNVSDFNFTNAAYTFTLTGDTDNVANGAFGQNILSNLPLPASFTVGSASGTLTTNVYVFTNQNLGAAGFGLIGDQLPLIDMGAPGLTSYDMMSAFDPSTGTLNLNRVTGIGTSDGSLTFTSVSGPTFAATGGVVIPETGTLALVLPALGMVGTRVVRRRKK